MKVRDILALCSCRVDIYNNGKFIDTYEDYKDLINIEEWVLNSTIVDMDTDLGSYDNSYLELYIE